jgi:hypothetical protein
MINIENIKSLVIVALIGCIFLLNECGRTTHLCVEKNSEVITEFIQGINDTIYVTFKKTVHDTLYLEAPTEIIVEDSNGSYISLNKYETQIDDSLISGTITSYAKGVIVNQGISYTPKFPKYITRVDTVKVSKTINEPKTKFGIGFEVGGNQNLFNFSPKIQLNSKSGYSYSFRYGLLDKSYNIGVVKIINFKR